MGVRTETETGAKTGRDQGQGMSSVLQKEGSEKPAPMQETSEAVKDPRHGKDIEKGGTAERYKNQGVQAEDQPAM